MESSDLDQISVCGVICSKECQAFGKDCSGCNQLQGRVSWAKFIGKTVCPIYQCVKQKGYISCAQCSDLPCAIWLVETRNPDMSDDEYNQDIQKRITNLNKYFKNIKEIK